MSGCRVLITAGPTREPIDPVRFISNRSSGKMGYAVAQASLEFGAEVCLVSGPVALSPPESARLVTVESAREMLAAVLEEIPTTDIFVATAAVADYVPAVVADQKLKKTEDEMTLTLTKAPDILKTVGHMENRPFCVGFAAETQNVAEYARGKLIKKNCDLIAANQVGDGRAFDSDTNALQVFWRDGDYVIPRQDKIQVARSLMGLVAEHYQQAQTDTL